VSAATLPAAAASPVDAAVEAVVADAVTPLAMREALGRYATGVTIVTCLDAELGRVGLTVSSFNALSLTPPLVLWSLRRESSQLAAFQRSGHFAVNVLAADQLALSRRFASRRDDKFGEGTWRAGERGVPVLAGCVAVFECETVNRQEAGDHILFIGRVLALAHAPAELSPLVYQTGHYHDLGERL
jgi:flavin reductase (DIM6/NTAB) family NADH-FMN oxidoreductase RutF